MRQAMLAAVQVSFTSCEHPEAAWERLQTVAVEARGRGAHLILFPALTSMMALKSLMGKDWAFGQRLRDTVRIWGGAMEEMCLRWGRDLSRSLDLYVCPGTALVPEGPSIFHTAYLFGPGGQLVGQARQTHVTRAESRWGWTGEATVEAFDTDVGRMGFLIGHDARVPEVGRILRLQGADIILAPAALDGPYRYWDQLSGTWSQVQATQVYAVESFLVGRAGGRNLCGRSAVLGPCETTAGQSGILAQAEGEQGDAVVVSRVGFKALESVRNQYDIHAQLNPGFYRRHLPDLYAGGRDRT